MGGKEYFYTTDNYLGAGMEPFLEHAEQYLRGERTIPVSKTRNIHFNDIFFTFSNNLMQKFVDEPKTMSKPYEVALKYGFRGYSKGGKNGIFYIGNKSNGLVQAMPDLISEHGDVIDQELDLGNKGLDSLKNVKIVWHRPSGERIVGVYNQKNHRILFLDFARY